jgi:hypothetical protein
MFQKKLHDRHLIPADTSRAWTYAVVPNRFRGARWNYLDETHLYSISLVALNVISQNQGGSGRTDVLHFRDDTVEGLRKKLEAAFPNAVVFSTANPELSLKEAHALEVKKAKAEADARAAAAKEQERVVAASKELANQMSDAEVAQYRVDSLSSFIQSETWREWFRKNAQDGVGFLSFPQNEGRNRDALLRYCEQRGFRVPNHQVLDEGMRYMLNNRHFYMQNVYKRSQQDAFHAVVPFEQIQSNARKVYHTDEQIKAATKALQRVLPVGQAVNREFAQRKAREIGISDAMFNDIAGAQSQPSVAPDVSNLSAKDLKRELAKTRPYVDPVVRARL